MKRVIFTLIIIFCSVVTSASAQGITKEEFAEILSSVILCSENADDVYIVDMEKPSDAVKISVSLNVMECNSLGGFEPQKTVLEIDAIKSIVTAWEIRMGELSPAALGGYLEGYGKLSEEEKKIIDKAVMIGISPQSGKISKDRALEKNLAIEYVNQLKKTIEIMNNHGVEEVITSFRNEDGITGEPGGEITFYATLNEPPQYNDANLIMALYCDERLIDVEYKNYKELSNADFTIMHVTLKITENKGNIKAKAFIFDSLNVLKPIYEYKLLR